MPVAFTELEITQNAATVFFHGEAGHSLITHTPDEQDVLALLDRVERRRLHNFLRNVICAQSPYDASMPFGIAAFKGSALTLVDATKLLQTIIGPSARFSRSAVKELRKFDFATLTSALNDSCPKTIAAALTVLS